MWKSHISHRAGGLHSPLNGVRIPSGFLKPSKEPAYVIGVVAGYVWRRRRPRKSYHEVFTVSTFPPVAG
ncbi:MAG: hypothetical protein QXO30_00490 [Candidatus Caldarchaeum sp.]